MAGLGRDVTGQRRVSPVYTPCARHPLEPGACAVILGPSGRTGTALKGSEMGRRVQSVLLAALAVILAACQSVPPEERARACAQADWQRFGENDGRLGVATDDRAGEFADCADLGHPVNMTAYQTGRLAGLATFCTAENGYQVGFEGRRYSGVCPAESEADFLQGYAQGRKERPVTISPSFGIGVGSGGGARVGVGVGLFGSPWSGRYPYNYFRW
ncbi:MAG: DUF2799 domain-containing protein [Pseudomonadota bacterium]